MFLRLPLLLHLPSRLSLWLPSQCYGCQRWPSRLLCAECERAVGQPAHRCTLCAHVCAPTVLPGQPCPHCQHQPLPAWDCAIAALDYAPPWRDAMRSFKFHDQTGWARFFAQRLLAIPATTDALASATLLLPMPLADERLRERGYNQSTLLAQQLLRQYWAHTASQAAPRLITGLLQRHHTPTQHLLAREQRLTNVVHAFAYDPLQQGLIDGQHVVLVDDIMTTGATCEAACQTLRLAGAAQITVLMAARTPHSL